MLRKFLAVILIAAAWLFEGSALAQAVPRVNCKAPHQIALDLAPLNDGPLTLASVSCQTTKFARFTRTPPVVSPDANLIAFHEYPALLHMARRHDGERWTIYDDVLGVQPRFGGIRSVPALAWAANSQFVWTATQQRVRPSGFAINAMQPVRAVVDGGIELLPPVEHEAGTLDALLWAGGDGLAIAQFGTRGGLYRPERSNPNPTFAFIDAQRGVVLDSLPFDAIERLRQRNRQAAAYAMVRDGAATVLKNGKVRALLSVGEWVAWTQGEAPTAIPDPYFGEQHSRMTLSPDGSRLLVARLLRTSGGVCIYDQGCTPGRPAEGVLAALHDVTTGQSIWTIRTKVTVDPEYPTPAISPDGRYALIGLVPMDRALIALVSMDRGEIVQTIPAPGGPYAIGFARDGQTVWAHAYGVTALYDVVRRGN